MSDSYNSGYYSSESEKIKNEKCPSGGAHNWVSHGTWPSIWYKCSNCDTCRYNK